MNDEYEEMDEIMELQPIKTVKALEEYNIPKKPKNVIVSIAFHPGVWLQFREEILGVINKLVSVYNGRLRIAE